MKYLFISLNIVNGEFEYFSNSVHSLIKKANVKKFVNDYAKSFYGSKPEKEDDRYFFFGGEVAVEISSFREISKEEFDVLSRFL